MRLFVALELTPEIRAALDQLISQLQRAEADLRWARPEGTHLTLKFIGEVPPSKLAAIQEALAGVRSPTPVQLDFRGLGYFPNPRRPRVLWVGVQASENLGPLASEVEAALEPLGIPREKRPYVPHLTVGRFRSPKGLERLQQEMAGLTSTELGKLEAQAVALFESKLSPKGAVYTKLAEFPFVRS